MKHYLPTTMGCKAFFVSLFLILANQYSFSQAQLVKDIYPGFSSLPRHSVMMDGILYFSALDDVHGRELWRSDGTEQGTYMVKDLNPGIAHGFPQELIVLDSILYFVATNGPSGFELFRTNGTAAGTRLVKDIKPGGSQSHSLRVNGYDLVANPWIRYLVAMDGHLYFAADDSIHGMELWKSDGTDAGTVMLKDIGQGNYGSSPQGFKVIDGFCYFQAGDLSHGFELWKSDGTTNGTVLVKDINPGIASSAPVIYAKFNGDIYFSANYHTLGVELWKTDGTAQGTQLVADLIPGPDNGLEASAYSYAELNGSFFVWGVNDFGKLWKIDPNLSGPVLIANGVAPASWPKDNDFVSHEYPELDGKLIFCRNDTVHGSELWISDGSLPGTRMLKDIFPGLGGSIPDGFFTMEDKVYFFADDGRGMEVWRTDGSLSGTEMVQNIGQNRSLSPNSFDHPQFAGDNGTLFFHLDDGINGMEPWKLLLSPLGLTLGKETGLGGDTITLPLSINNFMGVSSFQGTISFDSTILAPISASGRSTAFTFTFGLPGQGIRSNSLTFSASSTGLPVSLQDSTVVLELTFQIKPNASLGSSFIEIDNSINNLQYQNGSSTLTPSVQRGQIVVTNCLPVTDAGFSMPFEICQKGNNPIALITGAAGGTFSIDQGAIIDSITGELELASTVAGTIYEVTYAVGNPCMNYEIQHVLVRDSNEASFSLVDSVCISGPIPLPTNPDLRCGEFSISNAAIIDPYTGAIDINSLNPGEVYEVSYQAPNSCPFKRTLLVKGARNASFALDSTFCPNSFNPTPVILGDSGGTFSLIPNGMVNQFTGQLELSSLTPNVNYRLYYNLGGICQTTSSQVFRVEDVTAPMADIMPLFISCGDSIPVPVGLDDCYGQFMGQTNDPIHYDQAGTFNVNWTFTDSLGNQASYLQVVSVLDSTPPDSIVLADLFAACELNVSHAPVTTDNCEGQITAYTLDSTRFDQQGSYQIEWNFVDPSGNSLVLTQNVIISDTTPPSIQCRGQLTLELDSSGVAILDPNMVGIRRSDNCGIASLSLDQDTFSTADLGNNEVTLTAVDVNENVNSCKTQVIVSSPTSNGRLSKDAVLNVFPNPTRDLIKLHLISQEFGLVEVSIFNAMGQKVDKLQVNKLDEKMELILDMQNHPAGTYIIQLKQAENMLFEKINKE
ncbi:MAG: T9SS type A sorting domain-containing protein [Bacteroidia bacterium]|nr:T9SS type A sorting domain-containing protein [Bacteroidia bacterium]